MFTIGYRFRLLATLAMAVVVAAATHPAFAQRGRGGFRRVFGVAKVQLATLDEVQQELALSDAQKSKIASINSEYGTKRREVWATGFDSWEKIRGRLDDLTLEASQSVDALLDPAQRTRLQQISIQQNGLRALYEPDVVAALDLSEEQKTKLAAARDANSRDFASAFSESGRDWWQQWGELSDAADARLLAVLSDEQRESFQQLRGADLPVDLSPLFRGRRR